jgi:hypothetical protein
MFRSALTRSRHPAQKDFCCFSAMPFKPDDSLATSHGGYTLQLPIRNRDGCQRRSVTLLASLLYDDVRDFLYITVC